MEGLATVEAALAESAIAKTNSERTRKMGKMDFFIP